MSLLDRGFVSFDTETTGVNVESDRIVTASIVEVRKTGLVSTREWLINPGVPIPEEASKIHGVTTHDAVTRGADASESVLQIASALVRVAA